MKDLTNCSGNNRPDMGEMYRKLNRPLICVPIVDETVEDIMNSLEAIKNEPADIIEWRIDHFDGHDDIEKVVDMLCKLKNKMDDIPLISTFRTHHEGGGYIDDERYLLMLKAIAQTGWADYIDLEIKRCSHTAASGMTDIIRQNGSKVITSCHYFECTPDDNEMKDVLRTMAEAGADVLKLAVMPKDRHDVLRLLNITEYASGEYEQPVITMSMGKTGLISRVAGGLTGSVLTFASVGKASAPGQIPAKDMKTMLDILS